MDIDSQDDQLTRVRRSIQDGDAATALDLVERDTDSLKIAFQNDPSMAFTGDFFRQADQLSLCAVELARHFQEKDDVESEGRALQVRYHSTATAHAYRRNLLGPAILELADFHKRCGDIEKADQLYNAMIKDFSRILSWGPTFDPDWLLAMNCLVKAMQGSTRDFSVLAERTRLVLQQSEELVRARGATP